MVNKIKYETENLEKTFNISKNNEIRYKTGNIENNSNNSTIIKIESQNINERKKKLKIGILSVLNCINVGNNYLKYAISVVLKEMGFIPYIIGTNPEKITLEFLRKTTNVIVIKNFNEIKRYDYDILMVNSDQTWRKFDKNIFDYGFLKFAENWNLTKFIYGASLGVEYWDFTPEETNLIKRLLKQFKGISIREKGSLDLIKQNLGITPEVVLDPTLLIDKSYYLDLVADYPKNEYNNEKFILVYILGWDFENKELIKLYSKLNYKIIKFKLTKQTKIKKFIYYINNTQAIISNSFHGTIFSILFNKPFLTLYTKDQSIERFISLGNLLNITNRFSLLGEDVDINLLNIPLNINYSIIDELRVKSLNFLKKNLYMK